MIYMLPPGLACMLTHRQKLAIDCFGCESLLQTSGSASPRFHNSPSKCHRIKMYIIGLTACLTSVRITNRGPFARARIADVRRAATRNLDMVKSDRSPGFTERPAQKEQFRHLPKITYTYFYVYASPVSCVKALQTQSRDTKESRPCLSLSFFSQPRFCPIANKTQFRERLTKESAL